MSSGSSSGSCSYYALAADVKQVFGNTNVTKWADIDNDEDAGKIDTRIEWAICLAADRINNDLRKGPYTIPFTEDEVPREITDLTARLAGVLLYESRGITDAADGENQLKPVKDEVSLRLRKILMGQTRLDLTENAVYFPQTISLDD